jgi:hypothetical protein
MFTSILINQEHNKIKHGAACNVFNSLDLLESDENAKMRSEQAISHLFIYDLGR